MHLIPSVVRAAPLYLHCWLYPVYIHVVFAGHAAASRNSTPITSRAASNEPCPATPRAASLPKPWENWNKSNSPRFKCSFCFQLFWSNRLPPLKIHYCSVKRLSFSGEEQSWIWHRPRLRSKRRFLDIAKWVMISQIFFASCLHEVRFKSKPKWPQFGHLTLVGYISFSFLFHVMSYSNCCTLKSYE